jgi:hypothetical protein
MTTHKTPGRALDGLVLVPTSTARLSPPATVHVAPPLRSLGAAPSDYDWPPSPLLELWALRVRLDAACRKGESREGWVSCRVLRRAIGMAG